MPRNFQDHSVTRTVLLIAVTALLVSAIEWGRWYGAIVPIPFLLLYASVVAAGGLAGMLAGVLSGMLASGFIIHASVVGFGPKTLTGDALHVVLGVVLYLGTGLILGRVRAHRNRFEQELLGRQLDLTRRLGEMSGRLEAVIKNAPFAMFLKDLHGNFQFANRKFAEWYGLSEQEVVGKTSYDIFPEAIADAHVAQDREVIEVRGVIERELDIVFADGILHPVLITKFPVFDGSGGLVGVGTINVDITERKQVEDALRVSDARFRDLIENSDLGMQIGSRKSGRIYINKACLNMFGYEMQDDLADLPRFSIVAAGDRKKVGQYRNMVLDGETDSFEYEFNGLCKDGTIIPVHVYMRRILWEGEAAVHRTFIDLSDWKRAEELLQQAQKMEAVGQLTGGIAHDFNNLLMVIQGNAELLVAHAEGRQVELLERVLRATERGAELTQRLLAFSRRQTLHASSVDLGELVFGMRDLLARTLGETVEVEVLPGNDPGTALADAGQIETALLNLAINARDAMPDGGKLTVECMSASLGTAYVAANPEAVEGDFMVLAVTDTGTGMSADVLDHAFEPFFTTKEVGAGSGLGLSMIFGFAKQSGGHVTIYSEEGVGTTVKLYLPRSVSLAGDARKQRVESIPSGSGEHVLVIEDDEDVRNLAVSLLEVLDYRASAVGDVSEARDFLANDSNVDLILSDVVLPGGVSGPQFAEEAQVLYPSLRIIFMSGYPAEAAMRNGFLGSDSVLLNKPFQRAELARAIRDALD
jgi:PAS domain S-box-containing protein